MMSHLGKGNLLSVVVQRVTPPSAEMEVEVALAQLVFVQAAQLNPQIR